MNRILLSILSIVMLAFTSHAQTNERLKKFRLNTGLEFASPVGNFNFSNSVGWGGSAIGEFATDKHVAFTFSLGFISFSGRPTVSKVITAPGIYYSQTVERPSENVVPILFGVKYFFADRLYGHFQTGVSGSTAGRGASITYAPSFGIMVSKNVDVSFKFQTATPAAGGASFSFIGFRAAYVF